MKADIDGLELELKSALLGTGLVQPVDSSRRAAGAKATSELSILCRQMPGQEAPWLAVVDRLLALEEEALVSLHVCRRYLRKNGKMVFGWHVGLSGTMSELRATVRAVVPVLAEARPQLDGLVPARPPAPSRTAAAPAQRSEEGEEPTPPAAPAPARRSQPAAPGQHPPRAQPVPRAPGEAAGGAHPPEGFTPTIRVVRNEVGDDGQLRVEEEMPLPHVYREMSKPPFPGSTRGAFKSGDGSFHPAKRRR